jgi:hypothetical protein
MAGLTRVVERLRLRADSESAVRRTALALEDAFRTATLPDAGARVICVRRLHLGRLPSAASPQTLSLLLESRFAGAHWTMRHGADDGADRAEVVWFDDAVEAHLAAALRITAGRTLNSWFWPLAVPRIARVDAADEQLRAIAFAVAAMEAGSSALPSWTAALVKAGCRERLIAALQPGDGHALARSAGISDFDAWVHALGSRRLADQHTAGSGSATHRESDAAKSNVRPGSSDPARSTTARAVAHDDRIAFVEYVMRQTDDGHMIARTTHAAPRDSAEGPPHVVRMAPTLGRGPSSTRATRVANAASRNRRRAARPPSPPISGGSDDAAPPAPLQRRFRPRNKRY